MEVLMNTEIHRIKTVMFSVAPIRIVCTLGVFCAICTIGTFCACSGLSFRSLGYRYTPGIYEGTAQGFRGRIRAAVQVDENGIAGIELSHEDDGEIGGAAMEELLELVLEGNSTEDIDAVTGATESSLGFLSAVDDALAKATAKTRTGKEENTMLD
jgi:fumarate reductase flavoprotein subunit